VTSDLSAGISRFALLERPVDNPDAGRLLSAFYDEQVGRYGYADPVNLDGAQFRPPDGAFIVIYDRERPVGCGGCRWYDRATGTVEIKKTYLLPAARGRGLGRALLARLERHAVGMGARRIVLETGVRNLGALRLFAGTGYAPTPSYAPGRNPAINRAFAKQLVPA
jgi:GNAT superfamily N-acetyltransferase